MEPISAFYSNNIAGEYNYIQDHIYYKIGKKLSDKINDTTTARTAPNAPAATQLLPPNVKVTGTITVSEEVKPTIANTLSPTMKHAVGEPGLMIDREIIKAVKSEVIVISDFKEQFADGVGYKVHLYKEFGIPVVREYGEIEIKTWIPTSGYTIKQLPIKMQKGYAHLFSLREMIELPDNVYAEFHIRSTYARLGILAMTATIDPGYKGAITFTMTSFNNNWKFYPGDEIGILKFFRLSDKPNHTYEGKYAGSKYLQGPKFA